MGRKTSPQLFALVALSLEVLPALCHRLITNPYPDQEWDSVIVSSDPITVREKTHNATLPATPGRPQKRSYRQCPENDFSCLYDGEHHPPDTAQILDKLLRQYSAEQPSARDGHPFDDDKGWVTLEPVPWSSSKIAKWHPNRVPQEKPWDYAPTTQRPVQQFWVSGSSFHPERPTTQWGVGNNDIITDNRPSGFPTGNYDGPDRENEVKGSHPNRMHPGQQPSTYPSNGNGEWVLLSTTKGYSQPQRHRWAAQKMIASRKVKAADISKYHEEDLGGSNRKSDENAADNSTDEHDRPSLQILYTAASKDSEPTTTFRRKVRLQVLPSLVSSSTAHNGLLEVDSNSQSVDEAHEEEEKMKKLKAIAKVKKNKIRGYKLVPTSKITGKGVSESNVMTLAAVGAGMIPATMALLVPMALGRRKRSLPVGVIGWREAEELLGAGRGEGV